MFEVDHSFPSSDQEMRNEQAKHSYMQIKMLVLQSIV